MILKSVSISFAAASIVTVSKTSGEHKNLVFFQHFWFSNQVVDMYNVSVSTHQIKSKLRFLFAVESVSRHYYYFWFCNFYFIFFHIKYCLKISVIPHLNNHRYQVFYLIILVLLLLEWCLRYYNHLERQGIFPGELYIHNGQRQMASS